MKKLAIYPSILTDEWEVFREQLDFLKSESELFSLVQIDVIDGQFADNLTLTPLDCLDFDFGSLQIDFHLMTEEPLDYVQEIIDVKDQLPIRSFIAQVERMSSQKDFIAELQKLKLKVGLSLDLHTPPEAIDEESWTELNIVQIMGVRAGFQGQEFNPQALEKIELVRQKLDSLGSRAEIILDGGVKLDNLAKIKKTNLNSVVIGSALWQADDK